MKTVVFHIQKGGVGKTTCSVSTAYELSKIGKTVLIDGDQQGNSSTWLIPDDRKESARHELADVLSGTVELHRALVEAYDNLWVLPTFSIGGKLKNYRETQSADNPFRFMDLRDELAELGFDYCVYDLSPGFSRLEQTILIASDELVIPMLPDEFSLDGIETFQNSITETERTYRLQTPIQRDRIVVNAMHEGITQSKAIRDAVYLQNGLDVYTIGLDQVFRKSQSMHVPAQLVKGSGKMKPAVAEELRRLAEILGAA